MAKKYIGIDIGGTKILGVVVSEYGKVLKQIIAPTPKNRSTFLQKLKSIAYELLNDQKISGIGVGVPGALDMKRKILLRAPNLPFLNGWQVEKFFAGFNLPVLIDNDSRCFLRAEAVFGAGRKYRNIAGLTIGTGIGGGIMIEGKIYYGAHNSAGEFGHVLMDKNRNLESLAAKKSDAPNAEKDRAIGKEIAGIINSIDPKIIILGGGAIIENKINLGAIKKVAKKYTLSPLAKKTPIVRGSLGQSAQAVGAALLFRGY